MTKLGKAIRDLRVAAGLKQEELEALTGITQGTISSIESGATQNPHRGTLDAIAGVLGVDADVLLEKPVRVPPDRATRAFLEFVGRNAAKLHRAQQQQLAGLLSSMLRVNSASEAIASQQALSINPEADAEVADVRSASEQDSRPLELTKRPAKTSRRKAGPGESSTHAGGGTRR